MEKAFKGKSKKYCEFEIGEKALLSNKFTVKNKNIKRKKFKGKKLYNIPVEIISLCNNTSYKIKIYKNTNDLNLGSEYYCSYDLLKKCNEKTWNELK